MLLEAGSFSFTTDSYVDLDDDLPILTFDPDLRVDLDDDLPILAFDPDLRVDLDDHIWSWTPWPRWWLVDTHIWP